MTARFLAGRSRRDFLRATLATAASAFLVACSGQPAGSGLGAAPLPSATIAGSTPPAAPVGAASTPTSGSPTTTASPQPTATFAAATPTSAAAAASTPTVSAASRPTQTSADAVACGSPTLSTTEGPYFKAGSPARASLVEPGVTGTRLLLSGQVRGATCQPLGRVVVDVWQADADGKYDNSGYRLRGHVLADESGRYEIETVVPGLYPGRTRHIHVKVVPPTGPTLTTQLFFPGEAANKSDGIYRSALEIKLEDHPSGKSGSFDFVINAVPS